MTIEITFSDSRVSRVYIATQDAVEALCRAAVIAGPGARTYVILDANVR